MSKWYTCIAIHLLSLCPIQWFPCHCMNCFDVEWSTWPWWVSPSQWSCTRLFGAGKNIFASSYSWPGKENTNVGFIGAICQVWFWSKMKSQIPQICNHDDQYNICFQILNECHNCKHFRTFLVWTGKNNNLVSSEAADRIL